MRRGGEVRYLLHGACPVWLGELEISIFKGIPLKIGSEIRIVDRDFRGNPKLNFRDWWLSMPASS
jgi:hypothetical protein